MGAQRAAWTAVFAAEAAAAGGDDHAAALLDLTKCFERLPHHAIVREAQRLGYNAALLRLALKAYRLQRVIGVDGHYSDYLTASRGITAGSGFATTELRLLLYTMVATVCKYWPAARIMVYVDDITIASSGKGEEAARYTASATDFCVRHMERVLLQEVSSTKSLAVAGRPSVASAILRHSRTGKLKAVTQCKLLGAPYSAGRRRAVQACRKRWTAFRQRLARLRTYRRAGGNTAAYVRTAGLPAITYAFEACGVADTPLLALRRTAVAAAAGATAGKNPDLTLHALSHAGSEVDPAVDAHALPLTRWAQAWWEDWVPRHDMRASFQRAVAHLAATGHRWNTVAGPAAAVVLTARRIGWQLDEAGIFRDDRGLSYDLDEVSPAAIRVAVVASVQRWRFDRVIAHLSATPAPCTGDTDLIDVTYAARGLLNPKSALGVPNVPLWTPRCRPWLMSAMTGGQWTQARRASVRQWMTDNSCQLCGAAAGTELHRHHCDATRPPGGWITDSATSLSVATALTTTQQRVLTTRGILAIRAPRRPVQQEPVITWHTAPPDNPPVGATWYVDGSVVNLKLGSYTTAGCAMVVVSADGALLHAASVTLPSSVRTAPEAELCAIEIVASINPALPATVTDCKSIWTAARTSAARITAARSPLAGRWRRILRYADGDLTAVASALTWAPAHKSLSAARSSARSDGRLMSLTDWRANKLADLLAKHGASAAAPPSDAVRNLRRAEVAVKEACAQLGAVTWAANHHRVTVVRPDGTISATITRDAHTPPKPRGTPGPTGNRPGAAQPTEARPPTQPLPTTTTTPDDLRPFCAAVAARNPTKRTYPAAGNVCAGKQSVGAARLHAASAAHTQRNVTDRIVAERAAMLKPLGECPTDAAQRRRHVEHLLTAIRSDTGPTTSGTPVPTPASPTAALAPPHLSPPTPTSAPTPSPADLLQPTPPSAPTPPTDGLPTSDRRKRRTAPTPPPADQLPPTPSSAPSPPTDGLPTSDRRKRRSCTDTDSEALPDAARRPFSGEQFSTLVRLACFGQRPPKRGRLALHA